MSFLTPQGSAARPVRPPSHSPTEAAGPASRFGSILFPPEHAFPGGEITAVPECFHDLNLGRVVETVTAGRADYDLSPVFFSPLSSIAAIEWRHEIFRDLSQEEIFQALKRFSADMRLVREHLAAAEERDYFHEKNRWFLDAAARYGTAVTDLAGALRGPMVVSRGLRHLGAFVAHHAVSAEFRARLNAARAVEDELAALRFDLLIREGGFTVRACSGEPADYSVTIQDVFARFRQKSAKSYLARLPLPGGMNHIEAQVLEGVARLNPSVFQRLADFRSQHTVFLDDTIVRFEREIQFYLAWREHLDALRAGGLMFCYPRLSVDSKAESGRGCFDLALAAKLSNGRRRVIGNDFELRGSERILVVTGPNQGGKTTFARMFGQLHHLARLGVPVPGTEVRLFLCDGVFTHFEREEAIADLRGKLADDLTRMHRILVQATSRSVVVVNEVFSSTTAADAMDLSRRVLEQISARDLLCVCVTFLAELATLNEKTVSYVAAVRRDDSSVRTFRIERRPADGRAYAVSVAEKYRLTYEQLKERLKR